MLNEGVVPLPSAAQSANVTTSTTFVGDTLLSAAMNAQEGLPGRKRPEDVLSIQDALYKAVDKAVERKYSLTGGQVKQILN